MPSVAERPAFLPAVARPFSRSQSEALLRSPPHSKSAFLQSIIPAPDFSRSSFTNAEVTSAMCQLPHSLAAWVSSPAAAAGASVTSPARGGGLRTTSTSGPASRRGRSPPPIPPTPPPSPPRPYHQLLPRTPLAWQR